MLQDCQQLTTLLTQLESQHAEQSNAGAALVMLTQAQQQYQDTMQQQQAHLQAAAALPSTQVTRAVEVRSLVTYANVRHWLRCTPTCVPQL